ncbi:MAG: NADPH-dependent glutamate synthase [Eubacterium sp.]|jgi:glutamate synthase (NADPH/NADH) small chain|nr:NADPH-dependent glutamate synthase [Eubacterium sp.]MCH4046673.1 NADPH-dependent glutamate synthase [Eubacterium sp.]MCH4079769.1 NADPH-dependent glutamate synthase [Eubacterium sp.]MCH4110329.1 NADPH-dependent glutamate synthase [Eubacterium sp.]MCI1307058.1 NADPH-dependent glutamate synthase [Eubacterium sp.]
MPNMRADKNPMPEQEPNVRNKNFEEVALGYTEEMALDEAQRCLNCKNHPCVDGCPVNVHIPNFIAKIVNKDYEGAYEEITLTNSLPAVCGRVCPQENQCESKCVRGIKGEPVGIGRLERFTADWHEAHHGDEKIEKIPSNGHKVAVVGGGPAGLTAAGDLVNKGYDVTVFESLHKIGGVLVYGIPQFRLPKEIVQTEVDKLAAKGVHFVTDAIVGKAITVEELMDEEGFEAVFVGTGAGLPMFMNIPGESYVGVVSANEYLTRINLMKAYRDDYDTPIARPKHVVIVGAGNVAMDASRCAKRMGAEVKLVYRRSEKEVPARAEEFAHAKAEGIDFHFLTNPVEILGDENGNVCGIKCIKMELGEPDASGRRRPVPIEGSEFVIDCDYVIMSLGTRVNSLIRDTTSNITPTKKGGIEVDENGMTSHPGIFAGGDAVTGAATVIKAMGAGKVAAAGIDKYIQSK